MRDPVVADTRLKGMLRTVRRYWVPLFVAACAAYLVANAEELVKLGSFRRPTHPQLLFLALALQALVWLTLSNGWRRVVAMSMDRRYTLRAALGHFALFSFGKYLPGKIWGAAARAANMGREGVGAAESIEATLQEQFLVLHSAAIVSALFLPFLFPGWVALAIAATALVSAPFSGRWMLWLLPTIARILGKRAKPRPRLSLGESLALFAHYSLGWILHGAILVTLYAALWGGFAELDPGIAGLLVLGNTVGMVAGFAAIFAPAGLGIRETVISAILASGMPLHDAVALSIAMRLWTVATDLGLGGMVLLARRRA